MTTEQDAAVLAGASTVLDQLSPEQLQAILLQKLSATTLDNLLKERQSITERAAKERQDKLNQAAKDLAELVANSAEVQKLLESVGATGFTFHTVRHHGAGEPDLAAPSAGIYYAGQKAPKATKDGAGKSTGKARLTLEVMTGKKLGDWWDELASSEEKAELQKVVDAHTVTAADGSVSKDDQYNSATWAVMNRVARSKVQVKEAAKLNGYDI